MSQPFVTAVCVTGLEPNRVRQFLPVAISCFEQQSYPADRRELLIVADGCFDQLPRSEGNVKVVAVGSKRNLGQLRNIALDQAQGDLIIQWDEDWHHPQRMEAQVQAQQQTPECALILATQVAYCFHRDVAFVRKIIVPQPGGGLADVGIHGTIIHPRCEHRYPEIPTTEDTEFLKGFKTVRMLDTLPSLYVRYCHDGGVSGHEHTMREASYWPNGTRAVDKQIDLENVLRALDAHALPGIRPSQLPSVQDDIPVLVEP